MYDEYFAYYDSQIGLVELVSTDISLIKCNFKDENFSQQSENPPSIMKEAIKQLDEYFKQKRMIFDLDLHLEGTEFQRGVWKELLKIPYGKTISYKELAFKIGNKNAIRAVANANAKNPISIIIPCHRVIGSNNDLRGYGGGIEKKKWLLEFEDGTTK